MSTGTRTNLINLAFAGGILFIAAGCFCSSNRPEDNGQPDTFVVPAAANSVSGSEPAVKTVAKKEDLGDFIVEHAEIEDPKFKEIDRKVKDAKLLEQAAEKLNAALKLPENIVLRTKDCKEVNAFYDPNDRSVTMCYELMDHFLRTFKHVGNSEEKAYEKMNDAVRFVFLHEITHALIDLYDLPISGNEEDAADRCSAYINLKELGDEGVRAVYAAADAFNIEAKNSKRTKKHLADEHLLREQRFYNSLCMIYGSDPAKHAKILNDGYLPKERAVRCQGEYQRSVDSWTSLLEPWRKN